MGQELIDFLSQFIEVTESLQEALSQSALVQTFPKGTQLLRQGEPADKAYFVLRGCIRSFILKNGEERTVDFFIEEDPALPLEFGKGIPSSHSLECVEETVTVVNTPEQEEEMLKKFPQLKALCLTMSEIMSEKLQAQLVKYRTSTAEERYLDLVERRPELLQRIPQYQIASYLGVKPESLSRIRKRLTLS